MKARFAQQLSNWATAAALIMAVTSVSNFMALTSQIQFMDLTTDMQGTPEVFVEFAGHFKAANFEIAQRLPDLGLPTLEDLQEYSLKAVEKLQSSFEKVGLQDFSVLVLQYCYALEASGQIAANAMLAHSRSTAQQLQKKLEAHFSSMNSTRTTKATLTEKLAEHRRLSSSKRLRGSGMEARDVELGAYDRLEHDVEDSGSFVVAEWTPQEWEEFARMAQEDGVTESDFDGLQALVPCQQSPVKEADLGCASCVSQVIAVSLVLVRWCPSCTSCTGSTS
ncbi:unnamed protein product [Symbiodinium necroappetens]|uniref:Uncharacterized protein n=1 Tax=Symbiodinium necroappetens TaxID=1628268 RepID=A0A812VSG5_9DINO|nr:unnamed protein product [Symbiodinium necroappetens]